jgi:hypothetical protein
MKVSVFERAQRYVSKMEAAISGGGGHQATFDVAKVLVDGFALSTDDALAILREYNARCAPPWTEAQLVHKVRSIKSSTGYLLSGKEDYVPRESSSPLPPVPAPAPLVYQPEKLEAFAGPLAREVDAAWLANRSVLDPSLCTTDEFLRALYHPERGEKVLIFLNEYSQGEAVWPDDRKLPVSGAHGVWYLAQPVTGTYRPNPRSNPPGKPSRRIKECVLSWRYLVLESDEAPPRHWLGAVVQLPLKISAIYTSGSRSVHVLVRVDCRTNEEWDRKKAELLEGIVALGACRGSLSGVRLTRLPNCLREGKSVEVKDKMNQEKTMKRYQPFDRPQLQKLLYLCPEPSARPICQMIARRDVLAHLEESIKSLGTKIHLESLDGMLAWQRRFAHFSGQSKQCAKAARDLEELIGLQEAAVGGAK